jgi:hypothetical protein
MLWQQWEAALVKPSKTWDQRLYQEAVAELKLSNTDIQQMRILAEPGRPLARLILFFLDSADELSKNVFSIDMGTESGKQQFLETQAQFRALKACAAVLGHAVTPQSDNQEKSDD